MEEAISLSARGGRVVRRRLLLTSGGLQFQQHSLPCSGGVHSCDACPLNAVHIKVGKWTVGDRESDLKCAVSAGSWSVVNSWVPSIRWKGRTPVPSQCFKNRRGRGEPFAPAGQRGPPMPVCRLPAQSAVQGSPQYYSCFFSTLHRAGLTMLARERCSSFALTVRPLLRVPEARYWGLGSSWHTRPCRVAEKARVTMDRAAETQGTEGRMPQQRAGCCLEINFDWIWTTKEKHGFLHSSTQQIRNNIVFTVNIDKFTNESVHSSCIKKCNSDCDKLMTKWCWVRTLKLLNSQEQSFEEFTRMLLFGANWAEPRKSCVAFMMLLSVCHWLQACSSTPVYGHIVGINVLGQWKWILKLVYH